MATLTELVPGSDVLHGVGVRVDMAERTATVLSDTYSSAKLLRQQAAALDEAADLLEAMEGDR